MDFDEDVWVGRLIRSTIENIVKELKEEKGLGEGGTRSPSVESLVILSELPTYDEVFNGFQPSKSSSSVSATSKDFHETDFELFICAIKAAEVFAKAVSKKRMSRKEKDKLMEKFATFVRGEIGLKDAKKQGADEKNSGGLSLVVYNSTGPDGRRRQRQDTSSKKRGRYSRFRCILSSLCCCR